MALAVDRSGRKERFKRRWDGVLDELADDPTPANLRRIEVTRRDVRSTLEALVEDVRSRT